LEGGEELKGEAQKMVDKAVNQRVETALADYETAAEWDLPFLEQDLLMHYLLRVPEFEDAETRPTTLENAQLATREAAHRAFSEKLQSLDQTKDENGKGFGDRLLSLVMLNVLDEKWKDHLYDLDQLRNAIHYRSWGQQDPLIEYKREAYSMFVDLMNDIYSTFTERFLKAQLLFDAPQEGDGLGMRGGGGSMPPRGDSDRVKKRYNALGILEDIPEESLQSANGDGHENGNGTGTDEVMDIAADEPPKKDVVARRDPIVVGAGRTRSLNQPQVPASVDWSNVGRNDPCPCGSGKKFKQCHGARV
jgi:preprotein translocase subunit SecA